MHACSWERPKHLYACINALLCTAGQWREFLHYCSQWKADCEAGWQWPVHRCEWLSKLTSARRTTVIVCACCIAGSATHSSSISNTRVAGTPHQLGTSAREGEQRVIEPHRGHSGYPRGSLYITIFLQNIGACDLVHLVCAVGPPHTAPSLAEGLCEPFFAAG